MIKQNGFGVKFDISLFFTRLPVETRAKRHFDLVHTLILYYYCGYMNFFDKMKQTWADKAAFLAIFIAGLVIAHFLVLRRSTTVFSEPSELDHMGVSVSLPVGNGWQSDKKWTYAENNFTVSSFFSPGSANPTTAVHCRYFLGAADTSPEVQIQQKAHAIGGVISEKGSLTTGSIVIDWVLIKVPATESRVAFDMLFGSGQLPEGRMITIEVRWSTEQGGMAKEIFKHIVAGFKFKGSPLLDCGIKVVGQMRSKGLSRLLTEQNKQSYFVIKNTKNQPIGYVINILADLGPQVRMNVQAASSFYIRGRRSREQVIIFQGKDDLSEYVWKSETVGRFGRGGTEGVLDRTGTLAVKDHGTFIFGGKPEETSGEPSEERFYRLGQASVPDVLADLVYSELLKSEYEQIMIDTVTADGTIVPVVISRTVGDKTGD